jgi:hypothetical protein
MVSKSVQQCKLRSLLSLSEIERVETVLHAMYVRAKAEEGFHIQETETKIRSLTNIRDVNASQQDNTQVRHQLVKEFILWKPLSLKSDVTAMNHFSGFSICST